MPQQIEQVHSMPPSMQQQNETLNPDMKSSISAKLVFGITITYIIILIWINISAPLGLHTSIAIGRESESAKTFEEYFYDLFFWRKLSSKIVKENKNKCDLPRAEYYEKNLKKIDISRAIFSKENIPGKNERIAFLIYNHNKDGFNSELIFEYLLDSIKSCDINYTKDGEYPPIITAIFFANIKVVNVLAANNANLEKEIQRPGKSIDGLKPLEFAKLLESKEKEKEKIIAYREIIKIIQEKLKIESHSS